MGAVAEDPRSLERVRTYLGSHDLDDRLVVFERSTRTAQMAADAVGCELGQIVKSLVFVADDEPLVALVAGDRRGDAEAIAERVGADRVRMAGPEAVREATGYAAGGVAPFDLPGELTILIDDSLERFDEVYTAAGTSDSVVRLTLDELLRITGGQMTSVSH